MLRKINDTQDLKAIGELQVCIAAKQAVINNELTELQMIRQLQIEIAEKDLIEKKKREMSRQFFYSYNNKIPRIK